MVRLIQMCGVRGWILLAVCGLLLTGAALGQDPQKPGAKPAEKVADKPAAKTQSPTTQPTTLPATQGIQDDPAAKLQALREMKEKIRALRDQRERELVEKHKLEQEEARGATGERRTQQPATQPAERPATAVDRKPATTETKKPTPRPTIDELRRRAALSTQEGVTEPGHPDEDEQAAHPDRRREPAPPLGDIERPPGQEAPQVTPLPKDPEEEVREVPTPRRPEGVSQPSGEEPAEPGAKGPEGEWFAFDGMPWEDVVRHMARRIGKPLMYEDQIVIGGELTYHNERIFTKDEALDELNLLLHELGYRFIETEHHIYVVPLAEVPQYIEIDHVYETVEKFQQAKLRDMDFAIVYVEVKDYPAQQVLEMFNTSLPDYALLSVVGQTNKLKVQALVRDINKLLVLMDRVSMKKVDPRETRFITVKTNVRDIERFVREQFDVGSVRPTFDPQTKKFVSSGGAGGDIRITADDRANTLIVKATPTELDEIEEFVEKIDSKPDLGFITKVIEIQHANATEVATLLNEVFRQEQAQQPSWQRLRTPTPTPNRSSSRSRTPPRTTPQSTAPQDILGEGAIERAKKTIRIVAFDRTNSIAVYANQEGHERVEEMLQKIDVAMPKNFRTFKMENADAAEVYGTISQIAQNMEAFGVGGTTRRPTVVLDEANSALHVMADRAAMQSIEEVIKELDVTAPAGDRHVVELQNLAPSEVARVIEPLLNEGRGTPAIGPRIGRRGGRGIVRSGPSVSGKSQIIPLDDAGILIVICPPADWAKVEETIQLWDSRAISDTPEIRSFVVQHGDPSAIADTLGNFYRTYEHPALGRSQVLIAVEADKLYVQAIKPALEEIEELLKSLDVEDAQQLVILPLAHADATQVAQYLQSVFGGGGAVGGRIRRGAGMGGGGGRVSIQPEVVTNSLIVQADKKTLEDIKDFAQQMDEQVAAQTPERKFYSLTNASSRDVINAINSLFGRAGRGGRGQSAGQQVNAVVVGNQVVVEAPAEKQREIEALVTQLDTLSDQGITTLLVKMPGADVRSIAGKLSSAFQDRVRQQGITARFEADTTTETILMTCSKDAQEEAEILLKQYEELTKEHIWQTEFRQLKHASADEASNWLREQLVAMVTQQIGSTVARQIKVTADNRTNRVFMNAPQIAVKQGLLLLEQFDQPSEDIAPPPVEVWTVKLAGLDVRDLANNLQRVLNNMPPRPDRLRAVVTADQLTSNIIVSAPKDMKTQIDALIAQFSAETADMTPVQKFIEIKEADANYIADQMRRILGQQIERQRGRGAAQQMSLEVDARTNRLILNAPKFAVEMAEALIAELDKQPITGQLQTIALLNADANTVYGIIRTIFSEKIRNRTLQVSVEPLTNSLIVGGSQKDIDEIQKWSADLDEKSDAAAREQKIVDLQNANPWEVSGILQQVFVQRRRVPPSKEVNINILAGRSLVITAPPDVMKDIEAMVAELDGVTANKTVVKTIKVPGLGTQLPALARSVQDTINQQMQAREQRISIAALPAVDTLVVTALERQLPDVEAALEQFKTLFEPPKMVTFELKAGDANTVYQALNRVLQQQIRAGKIQMSVEGMTNALIVMAAEEEMADIAEWIAKFDEAAAAAIVTPRIFELKNANPWEVSGILQATFVPTGVGSRRGGVDIRFDILGGRSIVAKAPAEKMKQIEQLINELDTVVGNKARVATYVVPGMGARLTQFARDIQNAVNSQVQARDQRISVVANPAADVLVVTALEDQFELIQQAMDQFKDLYKPMKIETVALQHADANMVYQALNRVLQNKIRADKIQLSVESMTNSLIVVAAEAELEEIREWAASFDEKARESVTEPKIVELKNASPWEVVGVLNTTFVQRGQRARGGGKEISFQVMGGCSIVMHAPADQYAEIEALITQLDEIGSNKAAIRTYDVPGMGSKLTQFAREIESAVNTQVQQRDRRISVVANPTADVLIVTALEEQYELINDAMEQFKGLYKPTRIETIALQHGDANNVYQSLNTVLQNEIRAGKVQIGVEGMTNSLVVMGTDEGIAQIKEWTAKYEEKAQASITKPRIFELKNANPWEVQSILQTTFTPPGGARRQGGMEIRFDIIGGRSLVVKAPAEKLDEIAALIADLDEVGGNKTAVRTYELTGMGNKLNDLARQVREAVNVGMQAREQRISVTAYPPADALIVTATQDQFERVEQMMDEFKPLMEVSKFATEFFKLQYVDAGQIVGPVQNLVQTSIRTKGMSSRGAQDFTVTADVRTNRLIVFAPESIMPEVRTTVKELDIDMPDDNVVTIALNYADPWETQRTLTDIFRPRRGGDAAAQEVYITVSNNTLVVKAPKKKMEQIQELIARIDAEDTDGLQIKTYELKVLNASMVAGQVQAYLRSLGTVNRRGQMQPGAFAEPTTNTLVVIASERHLPFIEGMIMKLEATTRAASEPREYVLQNARADLVSRSVEAMLKAKVMEREGNSRQQSIQVSVFPDQVSNRLFVYAPEEYQELAAELIKMVDKDVDTGEIVHIVQLEQADAVELAQTINQIIQSGGVGGYGRGRSGAAGGSARQVVVTADAGSNSILLSGLPKDVAEIEGFIDELETNSEQVPELQIFQLQYATTMEVADALQSIFPSGGGRGGRGGASKDAVTITEDDYNNRLLVTANKRKMRQVEAFVKQLDAQPDEDEYLSGMYQGRELHFVDVYRGDATDIAWDVSGMLPPQDKGGPIVETDWFGEYIKVWCRPGEFPKIEKLIRDFEGRARVERTVSIRKLTDPDQTLALLADREGENIEIKQPGEKHRIESLIEDLWAEDEEPPAHQRQRAKTTPVNRTEKDVQPCPLPFALLAELAQEVETAVAGQDPQQPPARQDPPAEANQDSPAKVSSPPTAQDAQDERERGAEADDAPRQRERVQITMQPDGSVIIYGPQSQVDDINAAIDLLEEDITIGEVIRIFRFRYGDVNAAAEILDRMFNERQIVRIQQQQQQQPQPQQRGDQGGRGREQQQGGLMEQFRSMAGGRGTQATGRNGRAASGQRVRIATDPGHNYLIVKCDESDLPEIRQLLRELDIRPGQVDIKVFQLRHLDAVETAANIKDALGIARAQRGRENPFSSVPRGGGGNQQQQLMQMLQQQTVSIQGVEGGAKVESVEIVPNRATNSLMVSAPPEVMEIIAGTIDKLEKLEGYDVVVIRHYDLKVARMDDILPLLQEIFDATGGGGGRRAARGGTSPAQMGPVTISGDPRSNTLIYTCEAKDVEIVEAQIAALDVQGSINEAETYVCRFGDAAAIADVVTAIYGAGSGGGRAARGSGAPGGSEVRIVAEAVTNTIVVWGPPDKRDLIFAKIEELDKLNEQDVYEIPVVHADPEELADTLMQMFSGRGASVGSSPRRGQRGRGGSAGNAASGTGRIVIVGNDAASKILVRAPEHVYKEILELVQILDQPSQDLLIKRFDLKHAYAEVVVENVKSALAEYIQIQRQLGQGEQTNFDAFTALADPRTNSVIIVGSQETFLFVEQVLAAVDVETPDDQKRSFRIFVLEKADAETVADAINSLSAASGVGGTRGSGGGRRGASGRIGGSSSGGGGGELNVQAAAEEATNAVMVYGLPEDIAIVETSIIEPFEKISEEGKPFFVKLKYARASVVADTLEQFFRGGQSGMRGGGFTGRSGRTGGMRLSDQVSFAADPDTNTLIILASGTNREFIDTLIAELDQEEGGRQIEIFQLQFADANSTAEVVTTTFEEARRGGVGRGGASSGDADRVVATPDIPSNTLIVRANPANMEKVRSLIEELEQTIATRWDPVEIKISNAPASQVASFIWQFLGESAGEGTTGGRGSRGRGGAQGVRQGPQIIPNDSAQTLIVRGSQAEVERIRVLAGRFDNPDIVASRVKIIEVPLGQDAGSLASEIERIVNDSEQLDADRTGRQARLVVVGSDAYTNSLIVAGDPATFGTVDAVVAQLASIRPGGSVTRIIQFTNLSAEDAVEMIGDLQQQRPGSSSTSGTRRRTSTPTRSNTGTRRRGSWLWTPTPRELLPDSPGVAGVTPFVGASVLRFGLAPLILTQVADEQRLNAVIAEIRGSGRHVPTSMGTVRGQPASLLLAHLNQFEGGRQQQASRRQPTSVPRLRAKSQPASILFARLDQELPQEPRQSRPKQKKDTARRAAPGRDRIPQAQGEPAALRRAQEQERAERPKRAEPQTQPAPSQVAAQQVLGKKGLPSVSGALRGDVTATPLDSRRIVVTGDPRDVDFIEQLLLAMEIDAPVPKIEVFTLEKAHATALAPILSETIDNLIKTRTRSPGPADEFSINAEARSNSLIVSATEANMALIEEMINKLDIATEKDTQFKAVPLVYMRAVEAVAQLTPVLERLIKIRDIPANAQPSIEAIDRSNSILIVGTPSDIAEVESLITTVDVEISPDEERFGALSHMVIVGLKNGNAEDIAKVLTDMIKAEQDAAQQATGGKPGAPVVRKLRLTAPDGRELPELDLEKPIRLIPEAGTNSVIVFSTEKNIESLTEIVQVFDTLPIGEETDVRAMPLRYASAAQVAEVLKTIFDDGKKALLRPSEGDSGGLTKGVLPPVPPGLASKGLPYNVVVTHDARSNTLFVVGRKDAVLLAAGLVAEIDQASADLGIKPYVLELKNIQATTLAEKLDDLLEQRAKALADKGTERDDAVIIPDDRSNALIVLATQEIYDMVEDLALQLDTAQMYRVVDSRYRRLEYADALKLRGLLQEVFDRKEDAVGKTKSETKDVLYVTADARSNSLMLTGTRDYLTEAEQLIDNLDRRFDPTVEFVVRKIKLSSAANIATLLENMIDKALKQQDSKLSGTPIHLAADPLSNSLLMAASHEDMALIERWVEVLDRPSEVGRNTLIMPLQRGNAEDIAKSVENLFQGVGDKSAAADVTVTFDAATNSIVAFGPPTLLNDIEDIVSRLVATEATSGAVVRIFKLEEADAEDAGDLLTNILEGRAGTVGGGRGGSSSARQDAVNQIMLIYQQEHPALGPQTLKAMRSEIVVIADVRANTLVVTAPVESMPLMESLVAAIDVPPDASKIRVFKLRNADAEEMATMLGELFEEQTSSSRGGGGSSSTGEEQTQLALEGGIAGEGGRQRISFTTDVRTNSVIAAGTTGYLDLAEELILSLDTQPIEERKTMVYSPRNIVAAEIAATISDFSEQERQWLDELGDEISVQRKVEREIVAIANEDANRVILSYSPRFETDVFDIVNELDQPPPQVMIQVLIVEVTMDNSLELGVEFAFQDLQFTKAGPTDSNTFDFVGGTDIGAAGGGLGGFTFTITGKDFNFLMRALQNEGSLQVLSRPQIVAMDNQEASMEIINDVPYVSATSTTTAGQITTSVAREEVGIVLTVTPQINPDGFVRMDIKQEVSDFSGSTVDVGPGVTAPVFFRRIAETTVTVKDNETVVLGGLITSRDEIREQKVPILGDIPGLGMFFRNDVKESKRTELLVVLTPRVVRTVDDYRELSVAERDQTGLIPAEMLSNPLMQGLRVKPEELHSLELEELGPFPDETAPANQETPTGEEYGPFQKPALRDEDADARSDPNSYNIPIVRRFNK